MLVKTVTFQVSFVDGANADIEVDGDLFAEVFDGPDPTPASTLTLATDPGIIKNPLGGGKFTYHVDKLDISDFCHSTVTVKWWAKVGGVPILEHPVIDTPAIDGDTGILEVQATSPASAAHEVDPKSNMSATFNLAVDPDTVNVATFFIYDAITGVRQAASVSVDTVDPKMLVLVPDQELLPNRGYMVAVVGRSADSAGGYLKATDGSVLTDSFSWGFKTSEDRYEKLEEVASRDSIDRVAPVRVSPPAIPAPAAAPSTGLQLESANISAFGSNIKVHTINPIELVFSEDMDINTVGGIKLVSEPVLGLEDYLACVNGDPAKPKLAFKGATCVEPAITYEVDGKTVKLVPDVNFLLNSEITVTIPTTVKSLDGSSLDNELVITFTTEYFPLFVSPEIIRLELGDHIAHLADDTIRRYIHKNTLDFVEFRRSIASLDLGHPGNAARRVAKWCTVVDLLELQLLDSSEAEMKQLGQLVIQRTPDITLILKGKLGRAREECKKAERTWNRGQLCPRVTIKGVNSLTELPNFRTRTWRNFRFQKLGDNNPHDRFDKVPIRDVVAHHDHARRVHNEQWS